MGLFTVLAVQTHAYNQLMQANLNLKLANQQVQSARDRAENHLDLALRAIEQFHRSVSQNPDVQNRPDLQSLRHELLEEPLKFYAELKRDLAADADDRPERVLQYAQAIVGLAAITAQVGSEPDAIAAYQDAIGVLDRLVTPTAESKRGPSDHGQSVYESGNTRGGRQQDRYGTGLQRTGARPLSEAGRGPSCR